MRNLGSNPRIWERKTRNFGWIFGGRTSLFGPFLAKNPPFGAQPFPCHFRDTNPDFFWGSNPHFWGFLSFPFLSFPAPPGNALRGRPCVDFGVPPARPPLPGDLAGRGTHAPDLFFGAFWAPGDVGDRPQLPPGAAGAAGDGGGGSSLPLRVPVPLPGAIGRGCPGGPAGPGLLHPEAVEGLVLVNLDPRAKGWMDWAASKLSGLTTSTNEMILGHLFTQDELAAASPVVRRLREHLPAMPNAPLLWTMYTSCPVLLVVGDNSPHEDAVVECNAKLDPTQTSFLKMADGGGQPQITQPGRLTEAIKYFLQGMGYMAASAMTRLSRSRTGSVTAGEGERSRSRTLSRGSIGGGAAPPPTANP
ncbi:protein NDRG2-like isoform X2 [Corvus hawaiiensis]|uniref:protein NDRG2-like isoform X2 n=1 Tax=Corvus hawaiiensis TaxID=134902 RepID=UPI00201877AA|nr:protein NDRG2-like isoform X2 [Corvus hawaiiensis]